MKTNEGRIGYLHVCKDGEEPQTPQFDTKVFDYEGNFDPIPLPC